MRLFIDNCLSPRHARALHVLFEEDGHRIVHLRERFSADCADEVWLPVLDSEGGWCVLTNDHGIRRKPRQRELWMRRSTVVFFLGPGWSSLRLGAKHSRLSTAMDSILETLAIARPGSGYLVHVSGKVVRVFEGPPRRGSKD